MSEYQSYVICTSPRSGSTLLCQLLAATGKTGNPNSHFHEPSISEWLEDYNLSADQFDTTKEMLKAIFDAARARGTNQTGMFGLRLQRRSFNFFVQQMDILYPNLSSDFQRFQTAFGKTLFIHLTRTNKLEQSISFVKAEQTGLWHKAQDGTELERLSAHQEPVYDTIQISQQLSQLTTYDEEWKDWFQKESITPLRITYDELEEDPIGVLGKIVNELGLDQKIVQGIKPTVAKLADTTSQIWADRFLSENHAQIEPSL